MNYRRRDSAADVSMEACDQVTVLSAQAEMEGELSNVEKLENLKEGFAQLDWQTIEILETL